MQIITIKKDFMLCKMIFPQMKKSIIEVKLKEYLPFKLKQSTFMWYCDCTTHLLSLYNK